MDDMVEQIKEMLDSVNSLEEFWYRLIETYPAMTTNQWRMLLPMGWRLPAWRGVMTFCGDCKWASNQ
ncbi:hypothetical protein [Pseudomonas sp. TNT2022 ID642]|uniref:hypothetical protein n=1 Tax=Pseudomonas sp. TNT2022 ID642 TaxID=2942632 RepID=UPI002360B5DF|nr:hypothetical protein [Pseudomonas sp. TNT2022 ID642]MDD1004354.1 DUF935 domain-containing protein [Pseudomonas sp. TNT2022 ID642]